MTGFTLRHSCALGALATAALYASPAFAQAEVETAGAATQNDNRIVVTGSYIRGTPEDAALPVDVFTADDLAEQGVDSPLEFIKELPSVGASLGDSNQFSTDAQGFQGVGSLNLRGLGPQRTLVLLNGKRTILSPGAGFVDTQLMPLFALERIHRIFIAKNMVYQRIHVAFLLFQSVVATLIHYGKSQIKAAEHFH